MGKKFEALAPQHQAFVLALLRTNGNRSQALRVAGLNEGHSNETSTQHVASVMYRRDDVSAAYTELLEENIGSGVESLERMTRMARVTIDDLLDENGKFDVKKARANGSIHMVAGITERKYWDKGLKVEVIQTDVKLHDAKDAEKVLMKYRGMLIDRLKIEDLPEDPKDLTKVLRAELERVTGKKVPPAKEAN